MSKTKPIIEELFADGSDWQQDLGHAFSEQEQAFIAAALEEGYALEAYEAGQKQRAIVRGYRTIVGALEPNPWNPNRMSKRGKEALGESLTQFGQVLECVVCVHPENDSFMIVDGEHRYRDSGEDDLRAVSVNVLLGYEEAELMKLTVILNEHGEPEEDKLAELLGKIKPRLGGTLAVGLPYERDRLDGLLAKVKPSEPAPTLTTEEDDSQDFPDPNGEPVELPPKEDDEPGDAELIDFDDVTGNAHHVDVKSISAKLPISALGLIGSAYSEIAQVKKLDSDEDRAWGQAIAVMAASFMQNGGAMQLED